MISCRSCGNTDLLSILSLGKMPLANALLTQRQLTVPEETFPLDLAFCPQCTLIQITEGFYEFFTVCIILLSRAVSISIAQEKSVSPVMGLRFFLCARHDMVLRGVSP